jgi:hypothetical protein
MTATRKKYIVIGTVAALIFIVIFGVWYWHKSNQKTSETRRPKGIGGPAIEAFDKKISRWAEEMQAESLEESFALLNDLYEYRYSKITQYSAFDSNTFDTHEDREKRLYKYFVPQALSNRRFLKAIEDSKKLSRSKCVKLLTQCIQDNLKEKIRLYELDTVATVNEGAHYRNWALYLGESEGGNEYYRSRRRPRSGIPQIALKYGILSCVLLAGQLELGKEMRPTIDVVIRQARREYTLYNSLDDKAESFKNIIMKESIYNPSILVTGTLCDRSWNKELKKELLDKGKLINRETVDYRARTTEYDWPAAEGWIQSEPFKSKLPFRYYEKITDEEFNKAFP